MSMSCASLAPSCADKRRSDVTRGLVSVMPQAWSTSHAQQIAELLDRRARRRRTAGSDRLSFSAKGPTALGLFASSQARKFNQIVGMPERLGAPLVDRAACKGFRDRASDREARASPRTSPPKTADSRRWRERAAPRQGSNRAPTAQAHRPRRRRRRAARSNGGCTSRPSDCRSCRRCSRASRPCSRRGAAIRNSGEAVARRSSWRGAREA